MGTLTPSYSFNLPTVSGDTDAWGTLLNSNWSLMDDLLDGTSPVSGIDINGGSIDGTPIGASSASTGAFTTLDASGAATIGGTLSVTGASTLTGDVRIESGTPDLFLKDTNGTTTHNQILQRLNADSYSIQVYDNADTLVNIMMIAALGASGATDISFRINGTEVLGVDTDGIDVVGDVDATGDIAGVNITASAALSAASFTGAGFKDEDDMASNSATAVASQQSIKAYVDSRIDETNEVATTSNTEVDFTSISDEANEIEIYLNAVSIDATGQLLVQIGTSSTPLNTGYDCTYTDYGSTARLTSGFGFTSQTSDRLVSGKIVLSRIPNTNAWNCLGKLHVDGANLEVKDNWGSFIALGGTLDIVRLTTVAGTANFDAGAVSLRARV